MLGRKVEVGSGGFVQLVDVMGSDWRIVDAARISYGHHGNKRDPVKDKALLRYLMRHRHTTPFEQCEMVFLIRIPMDIWRQFVRHRTASINEYSTRYKEAINEMSVTAPGEWRLQATDNKQGSGGSVNEEYGRILTDDEYMLHRIARDVYNRRIEAGVAKEQARKDLPLSTYTEAYWKIDLHNLLHFLSLRLDKHAQLEIRCYAEVMWEFMQEHFPWTTEAFMDYRLNSVTFTALEVKALRHILESQDMPNFQESGKLYLSGREYDEFIEKIEKVYNG